MPKFLRGMTHFYRFLLCSLILVGFSRAASAQLDTTKPVKVAIFLPLYIDDVFDGYTYSLGKANIPKNVLPGLEFYNGVTLAIDSLNKEGVKAEVSIYDTKQTTTPLESIFAKPEFYNVGLIIAAITNTSELAKFSRVSADKHIPVISATYPNYVGVQQNPFFVLLNSSFQAHIQGLYKHMQEQYSSNQPIIAITKKGGNAEDYIKNYIIALNNNVAKPLKFRWLAVDENNVNVTPGSLNLDSLKNNTVFVASPIESFGVKVVKSLSSEGNYNITVLGMPTWDNINELDKDDCANVDIVYSTPFLYYAQNQSLSSFINRKYKDKYYSRPSDMVFKGFEYTYHFTHLLEKYRQDLINHLSDNDFTLFNKFQLEPVRLKQSSIKPDFLENKKLYFIKKQKGNIKSIS